MVLIDRKVCFVDELQRIIQEAGLDRDTKLLRENLKYIRDRKEKQAAMRAAMMKYRAEVSEPAWAILRERKAAASRHRSSGGVIKEPVTGDEDNACYYTEVLDGLDPFFSEVADAPGCVASLSLKISWPPEHLVRRDCSFAHISSCHRNLLVLYAGASRTEPAFYLVYNTRANSVAVVPPFSPFVLRFHRDIGAGVAVLCGKRDTYVLVDLLLHIDDRSYLPTNKGTLFMWTGPDPPADGRWIREEVVVPLPADQYNATTCYYFSADMVFAISSDSLCWVDLLKGILVYILNKKRFHFIPLPKGYDATNTLKLRLMDGRLPEEYYRSMCYCDDSQDLRFISMDDYTQVLPMDENAIIRTWRLYHPWSQTRSGWELLYSIRIRDLWHGPYKDLLKLPWTPGFPVISMGQPHIIYLSVSNYENNLKHATGYYVLSVDMDLARVVSVFKVPSGVPSSPMIFTYGLRHYQKEENLKAQVVIEAVTRRDLVPRGKGVADDGESRSNRAMWASSGDIGGPSVIGPLIRVSPCEGESLPYPAIGRLPLTVPSIVHSGPSSSSFCPVGLQCVLDQTEK